ncbi:MAG: V-type ATP synthase subunit E [Rhabdochlamydiaceae bacterium]|nr:V-type ATP synthase subunit E [Rhabdochlamydiaceae bacterium]
MKGIDTGKDKVKKICDVLKKETLEPAKKEAEEIVRKAEAEASQIIELARSEEAKIRLESKKEIEKERNVFQSSLHQACKQALETLKQDVEDKLFPSELSDLLQQPMKQPQVIVELISAVVKALEKDGIDADLDVMIPHSVSASEINRLLTQNILQKLKQNSVRVGPIQGGIAVKVEKSHITVDVTDAALRELVSGYIRKDFRETFFRS